MVAIARDRSQIGSRPHRVEVQQPNEVRDAQGGTTIQWETIFAAWASIEPLRGKEFWTAQQTENQMTHRVTIRWSKDVTTKMRLLFHGRVFNIGTLMNVDERGEQLELMCVEVVK